MALPLMPDCPLLFSDRLKSVQSVFVLLDRVLVAIPEVGGAEVVEGVVNLRVAVIRGRTCASVSRQDRKEEDDEESVQRTEGGLILEV